MKIIGIVEDDATMKTLLTTLLELEGFSVIDLSDNTDNNIIEKIYKARPDALLLDVFLKKGSGLEIMKTIRSTASLSGLHVLMSSGMDVKDECIKAGANGFLMKPYMPDDLIKRLRSI